MLAGISSDYYLRLEQGRDRNPSIQVLESLASVLRLDQAATGYLLGLATPRPRPRPRRWTALATASGSCPAPARSAATWRRSSRHLLGRATAALEDRSGLSRRACGAYRGSMSTPAKRAGRSVAMRLAIALAGLGGVLLIASMSARIVFRLCVAPARQREP